MSILLLLLILVNVRFVKAQELIPSASISSHISYTGFYLNLTPSVTWRSLGAYAGMKIALSETRIPTRGPYGFVSGIILYSCPECRIRGFFNVDYQYITFRPPVGLDKNQRIRVHEFMPGFGLQWKPFTRFSAEAGIYAGGYLERWPGFYGADPDGHLGYNSMVRLGVSYYFMP